MSRHTVTAVDKGSIAAKLHIQPGDCLCAVNGEAIEDVIDYESLTTNARVLLSMQTAQGEAYEAQIDKDPYEPLGLSFESGLMSTLRPCKNHCVFCFIDQLPKGGRETLHVKDDDWRLSLIMGNYITLTNVDDAEFDRILRRRVSPLYISVHATDGAVRKRMMNNPNAPRILERLTRLKQEGLRFHAQIVLCPGLNDGAVLGDTLETLYALRPAAQSVAVVPVGLTRYREGLYPLRTLTQAEARTAVEQVETLARKSIAEYGEAFAFASDELYILAALELPPCEAYEDFPQIENGVGLLRQFEEGFMEALAAQRPGADMELDAACGVSAAPFMRALFKRLEPYGIRICVHAVENVHFGKSVTVSGLLTGGDLADALGGKLKGAALLLPRTMMRERDTTFLDGMTLEALSEQRLQKSIIPMPPADGADFIETLFGTVLRTGE